MKRLTATFGNVGGSVWWTTAKRTPKKEKFFKCLANIAVRTIFFQGGTIVNFSRSSKKNFFQGESTAVKFHFINSESKRKFNIKYWTLKSKGLRPLFQRPCLQGKNKRHKTTKLSSVWEETTRQKQGTITIEFLTSFIWTQMNKCL